MSDRFFLDTNILIYTFDSSSPTKQQQAKQLVIKALQGQGVISFQVIQEFLNVALRKFKIPMSPSEAQLYLNQVLIPLCEIYPDQFLYQDLLMVHDRWKYSVYDSLIIVSALKAQCSVLYSEDLQHQHQIESLTIVNPFAS